MTKEAVETGKNRYRENFGRYLEDFQVGDIYQHRPGRTITEADNIWLTLLTMNPHPIHFDREYARHSEFGKCIVNGTLTVAMMVGMSVTDISQQGIANLGWHDIELHSPLFPGDTLYAESEVLAVRESKSRPTQGVVTVKTLGRNQDQTLICSFLRKVLIAKRGHSVDDKVLQQEQAARKADVG